MLHQDQIHSIFTAPDVLKKIRLLLSLAHSVFEEYGIEYMLNSGTLLGAVRHRDIIPWDDDGDLLVISPAPDQLQRALQRLRDQGVETTENKYGSKLFLPDSPRVEEYDWTFPFVDIFTYEEAINSHGEQVLTPSNPLVQSKWPQEFYYVEHIRPRRLYTVGSLQLYGPNHANDFLERVYPRWRTHASKSYDHERERDIDPPISFLLDTIKTYHQ